MTAVMGFTAPLLGFMTPTVSTFPRPPSEPSVLPEPKRVVVVGGGFAGIQVVRGLARAPVVVTLIDRRNFTLFQPLLYQVATGLLSPANIATPLRSIFARQNNARVLLAEVTGFEVERKQVRLAEGTIPFDYLVVACGSRHHYFGHGEWERFAPGLKSLEDAEDIRRRIFSALERAELTDDADERQRLLTFVVVGGGPTSVELAGALAEIIRHALMSGFRALERGSHRIILIEAESRLLAAFSQESSTEALQALTSLGVEVRMDCRVVEVQVDRVRFTHPGSAQQDEIVTATVLWGAGVQGSPVGARLLEAAGLAPGHGGRVPVTEECTLPGHPDIFVLGDMAAFNQDGQHLPGIAPVAIQQGDHAARVISTRLAGNAAVQPFRYHHRGNLATIGKRLAVADLGSWHLRGRLAWICWLVLHLMKLVLVENRLLVLIHGRGPTSPGTERRA